MPGKPSSYRSLAALAGGVAVAVTTLSLAIAGGGDKDDKTTVTIWRAPTPVYNPYYGTYGYGYGGQPYAGDAAFVTHRRSVEVSAEGELRFPGVSTRIDPSTVQFRSVTDPKSTSVVEQRYAYDLGSPDKLMKRYIGKQVQVTTSRGDVSGILRAIDGESLVIETGSGASRAVEIIRRGENLLDVKLAAGDDQLATVPTLVWKVLSKKPGKQSVEVSYRSDGLRWDADYTAILDDGRDDVDLSAWATIHNDVGVDFSAAEVVLVTGMLEAQPPAQPQYYGGGYYTPRATTAPPVSFTVPREVSIPAGGTVQVELMPAKSGVTSRRVVLYETAVDMSAQFYSYPNTDCYSYGYTQPAPGGGQLALEFDAPSKKQVLPEGKVRVFKRNGDSLELLGEDQLKVNASSGDARLVLGTDDRISGERRQIECKYDDRTRTVREKFEIKVENKSKETVEVILREYMYRWSNWRMDTEDITGTKAATQTQEYRVKLNAGSKKTFTYAVIYSF